MNINIVSLLAKMNELQALLSNFDKKPSLISLSETKITEKSNMHYVPFLENYTYFNTKSKSHFGSVSIFIRNELFYKNRTDLNCSIEGLYEMLWLDVYCAKK